MNPKFKICIYLKGREKPIILTDVVTAETPYNDTISFFQDALKGDNKIVTLDFSNDNVILNLKDIETVVISKPTIDTLNLVTVDDSDEKQELPKPLPLATKSEETIEANTEDDVFGDDKGGIEIVEG